MEELNKNIIQFNVVSRAIEKYSKDTEMKLILDKIDTNDPLSPGEQKIYTEFTEIVNNNKLIESQLKEARELATTIKQGYVGILHDHLPEVVAYYDLESKCK
jgi:hypothetical protein